MPDRNGNDLPTFDADLLSEHPQLARFADRFTELARRSVRDTARHTGNWMSDGHVFTCDGGAIAACLVAEPLAVTENYTYELHVGLYWHIDEHLRSDLMGWTRAETDTDADWERLLDEDVRPFMDEHHHWVLLNLATGTVLIDPNGPTRNEPFAQNWTEDTARRYESRNDSPDLYLVYNPWDDEHEIAADCYPGLADAVAELRTFN